MILVVTGSRALADTPAAERWARERIAAALLGVAILVTGDARGPDRWARRAMLAADGCVYVWRCDGTVDWEWHGVEWGARGVAVAHEPLPDLGWTPTGPRRGWPLQRNARMVAFVRQRVDDRRTVRVLALHAPWATTAGTAHTVGLARRAGLAVEEHTCPAEHGPRGGRG